MFGKCFESSYGKCKFRQSEIELLGHIFSKEGIRPTKDKIDAILKFRAPQIPDSYQMLQELHLVQC